jgi:hypothetical protein
LPVRTTPLDRHKEKLLLAGALLVAAAFAAQAFLTDETAEDLPTAPRVEIPAEDGAVLRAGKLVAVGSYWDEDARFIFAEPEKVRIFVPVALDVPTMDLPRLVMPLSEPGPLLQHSDFLPRLDGSPGAGAGGAGAAGGAGDGL